MSMARLDKALREMHFPARSGAKSVRDQMDDAKKRLQGRAQQVRFDQDTLSEPARRWAKAKGIIR